ncbi:MAG: EAL domain-containing protein [Rhodospirillales bacterium]|nr:EAL domain-containing protein [Rhodospirillales bacterium]
MYRSNFKKAVKRPRTLPDGVLFPELQPIVDIGSRKLVGFELLARINQNGDILGPGSFVKGHEPYCDRIMLEHACRFIQKLPEQGIQLSNLPSDFVISVNLHPHTVASNDYENLPQIVRSYGIPPQHIQFEVIEAPFPAGQEDIIVGRLKTLHGNGHPVVMDDYINNSAQNARLARLLHKEGILSGIKLDGACVKNIMNGKSGELEPLASTLGRHFKVVAEQAKLEDMPFLAQKGVTHSQSYETGRPTPWQKALRLAKDAFSAPLPAQNSAYAIA